MIFDSDEERRERQRDLIFERRRNAKMVSTQERIEIVLDQAREHNFPLVISRGCSWKGKYGWASLARTLIGGDLESVECQLAALEDARTQRLAREREYEKRAEIPTLLGPLEQANQEMFEQARRDAAWRESPEGVRHRTAVALEKLAAAKK